MSCSQGLSGCSQDGALLRLRPVVGRVTGVSSQDRQRAPSPALLQRAHLVDAAQTGGQTAAVLHPVVHRLPLLMVDVDLEVSAAHGQLLQLRALRMLGPGERLRIAVVVAGEEEGGEDLREDVADADVEARRRLHVPAAELAGGLGGDLRRDAARLGEVAFVADQHDGARGGWRGEMRVGKDG